MKQKIGLTSEEAKAKLLKYGKNILQKKKKSPPWKIFFSQFTSPLILLLFVVALISFFIGFLPGQEQGYIDTFLIIIIVIVSGIAGFFHEYRAEKSIEALQKISTPTIQVLRDNIVVELPVTDITVGDAVILESGDVVPADGEIIQSFNVKIDESILTGESNSVDKKRGDKVFMGTSVYIGSAKMIVSEVGMRTRIGKIASELQEIEEEKSSFEKEIHILSNKLFWATGIISIIIFISLIIKNDLYSSLLTAISLAVAAIPEGLPAVVTLSLALGARTMFKHKSLVRKLGVVESIGAVDVVCSDKTGTITKNEMTVTEVYIDNEILFLDTEEEKQKNKILAELFTCAAVCNNTKTLGHPEGKRRYLGEQTEIGLIKAAEKIGIFNEKLEKRFTRENEIPFSSERKMMSVVVEDKESSDIKLKVYSKGAPEVLLDKCDKILLNRKIIKLTAEEKELILNQNKNFAANALRVLGFAYKDTKSKNKNIEEGLIWLGLVAMIDPPHPEIEKVLADCETAGIRVIMITGDNAVTAEAIARKIKLKSEGVLVGDDLDNLSDKDLLSKIEAGINIYARTNPFHKLRILKILQKKYQVAMTGDGVNDSLALKQADVGIAMGKKGTTVAREASDMVLLDDNFATIVAAIKEGRRIFENIRKFINYLLVSNFAEVGVIFFASLIFTLKEPVLLPVQILWINFLTDSLPALALGADPARKDVMQIPPRKKDEPIINKKLAWLIGLIGLKKTFILLFIFFLILPSGEEIARTALFTGLVLFEFVRIASIRYQEKLSWFANPWLLMALFGSLILQGIVIYVPFINKEFHAVALPVFVWWILLPALVIAYVLTILITRLIDIKFAHSTK